MGSETLAPWAEWEAEGNARESDKLVARKRFSRFDFIRFLLFSFCSRASPNKRIRNHKVALHTLRWPYGSRELRHLAVAMQDESDECSESSITNCEQLRGKNFASAYQRYAKSITDILFAHNSICRTLGNSIHPKGHSNLNKNAKSWNVQRILSRKIMKRILPLAVLLLAKAQSDRTLPRYHSSCQYHITSTYLPPFPPFPPREELKTPEGRDQHETNSLYNYLCAYHEIVLSHFPSTFLPRFVDYCLVIALQHEPAPCWPVRGDNEFAVHSHGSMQFVRFRRLSYTKNRSVYLRKFRMSENSCVCVP